MKRVVAATLMLLISWAGETAEREMTPSIQEVKARHASRLLTLPGVVSIGVGRDPGGHEVIVIGLDHARPETRAGLPGQLEGHPVRVEIVGTVKAR